MNSSMIVFFAAISSMALSTTASQEAKALDHTVHFHFSHIGLLGNNLIVKVIGHNGGWQQWRFSVLPVLGSEIPVQLNPSYFSNGENATACATDTGNGKPSGKICDTETVDFNAGTDFYLALSGG